MVLCRVQVKSFPVPEIDWRRDEPRSVRLAGRARPELRLIGLKHRDRHRRRRGAGRGASGSPDAGAGVNLPAVARDAGSTMPRQGEFAPARACGPEKHSRSPAIRSAGSIVRPGGPIPSIATRSVTRSHLSGGFAQHVVEVAPQVFELVGRWVDVCRCRDRAPNRRRTASGGEFVLRWWDRKRVKSGCRACDLHSLLASIWPSAPRQIVASFVGGGIAAVFGFQLSAPPRLLAVGIFARYCLRHCADPGAVLRHQLGVPGQRLRHRHRLARDARARSTGTRAVAAPRTGLNDWVRRGKVAMAEQACSAVDIARASVPALAQSNRRRGQATAVEPIR